MRLALSGGGFRATLFHLGAVRFLKEKGLLKEVQSVHSVSGGSILAAHLVLNWHKYTSDHERDFAEAAGELVNFCQQDVRGRLVRRWILFWLAAALLLVAPASLTAFFAGMLWTLAAVVLAAALIVWLRPRFSFVRLLQSNYDALYKRATLAQMGEGDGPEVHLLATNLTTGDVASFNARGLAFHGTKGTQNITQQELPVAFAVAASSAFPALFGPVKVDRDLLKVDAKTLSSALYLSDGGVYDNLGLFAARAAPTEPPSSLLVSSAEPLFDWEVQESFGFLPFRAARATDILMERVSSLEVDAVAGDPQTQYIRLRDDAEEAGYLRADIQRQIRTTRTDLDRFHGVEIQLLVYRGYCAARQRLDELIDRPQGLQIFENGLPAPLQGWLPFSAEKMGAIGKGEVDAILRRCSKRAWRLWCWQDVASWLSLVLLLATLALSYPALAFYDRWWHSAPVRPGADLSWTIANASSGVATEQIQQYRNLRPYLLQMATSAAPEHCTISTSLMVFSAPLETDVGRYPVAPFNARIKPRYRAMEIFAPTALYVSPDDKFFSEPLTVQLEDDGSAVVACPPTASTNQLFVFARLCSEDPEIDLSREEDPRTFIVVTIEPPSGD